MTIYDIAALAGVSASTVSRVINGKPGIKAQTRDKVQALLRKYDYCPNETARGLVNQATKSIGILVADIRNAHHTDGAYFIERELEKQGYCSIIFNTGADENDKAEYIRQISQRRVDGVVLIGSSFQSSTIAAAIAQHLQNTPVVLVNGWLDLPNVYGVLAQEEAGTADCVALLAAKGHKKQAFVLNMHTPSNDLKLRGFTAGMQAQGALPEDIWIYETESSLQGGYDITKTILEQHPDIEAILFAVDLLAAGAVRALMDLHIAVPQQVAVMGIDNSVYGEMCYPRLSSLDTKLVEQSVAAARMLLSALAGEKNPRKVMLFAEIVERETT
ncbi:MAG: LacI family DNA-binding transcriptional regulator [Oscillospiraceae bacterium]|nr:LacI family DNA-binding transcriptional regulator [Oscillospiraceae bacterium]